MSKIVFENGSVVETIKTSENRRSKNINDIDNLIGYFINEKCPKCGATLLGNKNGDKWCSFVGSKGIPACDYGC